jgi:ATP-dependent exoDNAse (exonuclease V) beta subunit
VVGKLVHEALHRWRFPSQPNFEMFMFPHALAAGLTDPVEIGVTIEQARRLLERFQSDALFAEMDAAERFHEVPYTFEQAGCIEMGVIDLLYRVGESWRVVDFKTDEIRDEEKLEERIGEYRAQVSRYAEAVRTLVGAAPLASLCFLNVRGGVRTVSCRVA